LKDAKAPREEIAAVARDWAAFLEAEARRAPNPAARAVFDAHRLTAYLALGEPERALPMLAESEKDFPRDYNPPARLALANLALKRWSEAESAIDRALALAYGPRKMRLFALKADILEAKGDLAGARAAVLEALKWADSVPLTGSYTQLRAQLEKRANAK
jgi:hypothetical protein